MKWGPPRVSKIDGVTRVDVPEVWRPMIERACVLKEALDHANRWRDDDKNRYWIDPVLEQEGLTWTDFKFGSPRSGPQFPSDYLMMLLGSWFSAGDLHSEIGFATLPGWAVAGWVRKPQYRYTHQQPPSELSKHARRVNREAVTGDRPTTNGFEGMPLYWSCEGKNRTQLQRLGGDGRFSILRIYPAPSMEGLIASPVVGMPWAVALRYGRSCMEVLPFGDLARQLLMAFGVAWSDKACLPSPKNLLRQIENAGPGPRIRLRRLVRWAAVDQTALRLALIGGSYLAGKSNDDDSSSFRAN